MGSPSIAINLPYKPEIVDSDVDFYNDIESSPLYKMLPANAKEYVKASPHLLEYLHTFPVNTYGIPLFLSELKKDLRKMESPNIIYPVNETTFIHILPDPDDVRNFYIPIEPSFLHNVSQMLPAIEAKLVDMIDGLEEDPISDKERAEVIKKMLTLVTVIRPKGMDLTSATGGSLNQQDMKSKITNFLKTDFTAKDKMKNVKKKHQ
ncbi:MAG: secretion system protein E, partial [Methanoregula sp.]|nr:secretion system protein E [Methanoregula sp.]